MTRTRKTPETWITAGLKALSKLGVDGTRAETLARSLNTTKGSFYWHFKDVPDFHAALLAAWMDGAARRLSATIDAQSTPTQRLRALAGLQMSPLDRAVRAWAVHDAKARKTVAKYDQLVLDEIRTSLNALDATHPDFPALVLASMLNAPKNSTQTETLVDLLLVLK